ncbi:hypothetical protein [Spiroplasma endosymbiont of Diplazon laetatorius]|uniref:hypothetical protein n=1 Tax=Spiroplasma endosymbiont of Diplazon laetatorius TaxID=3066322 RepID=UPI0030CFE6B7
MKYFKYWKWYFNWLEIHSKWITIAYSICWIFISRSNGLFKTLAIIAFFVIFGIYLINWILSFLNFARLNNVLKNCPITLINGSLGSGKTLLMTYLLQYAKNRNIYSNWFVDNKKAKVVGLNNLDFKNKDYSLPEKNSLVCLDEIYLYMNATDNKSTKAKYSGTIPSYLLARQFDLNLIFAGQRINQHFIDYREPANLVLIPRIIKRPWFMNRSFKMVLWGFTNLDNYLTYESQSIKLIAQGESPKLKNNPKFGIYVFNLRIPLSVAKTYDSKYLSFVRDFKSDKKDEFYYWKEFINNDKISDSVKAQIGINELRKLGMNNLLENID